jgi:hypothetical protein
MYFVSRPFLDQEVENNADGFFRRRSIDTDGVNETPDEFVHYSPDTPHSGELSQ